MKKQLYHFFISFFLILFIFSFSCKASLEESIVKEKRILFDSFFEITVISEDIEKAKKDIGQLFVKLEEIGNLFDWRNEHSFLATGSKKDILLVPENFRDLFIKIEYYQEFTDGYFNPFLKKLVLAYNNFNENTVPPSDNLIKEILEDIKKSSFIKDKNGSISIKLPENLDLGAAIAGFLVDYSYEYLLNIGYKNFLINGSGEIRVSGNKLGKSWLIGIQSPFSNSIIKVFKLPDGYSISTSGSYERYFIYNNQKFHHILNPYTGKPDSKLESVSIVTKNSCLESDILSTAVFSMGVERALRFCEAKKIDYYIVYKENEKVIIKKSKIFD